MEPSSYAHHCGSLACCPVAGPCACECGRCCAVRLRARERSAEDRKRADWMDEEKRRARIDDGRDVISEYRAERGGR